MQEIFCKEKKGEQTENGNSTFCLNANAKSLKETHAMPGR